MSKTNCAFGICATFIIMCNILVTSCSWMAASQAERVTAYYQYVVYHCVVLCTVNAGLSVPMLTICLSLQQSVLLRKRSCRTLREDQQYVR